MRPLLVIFDFDNTLEEFTPHEEAVEREIFEQLGKKHLIDPAKFREVFDAIKLAYANPRAIPTDYGRRIWFEETFRIFHLNENVDEWVKYYWDAIFSLVRIFPGTYEVLEHLKTKHTLCILSDSDGDLAIKLRRIEHLGLSKYFDRIFTSDYAGHNKPNLRMFLQVLEHYRAAAEETVMIGDNPYSDLAPAKEVGIHTIWQKECHARTPLAKTHYEFVDYEVETITEVTAAVDRIEKQRVVPLAAVPRPQLHIR